jgi:hypothetical protein
MYFLMPTLNLKMFILFGDFNLDLIKLNENKQVKEYVDLLFSFGFLQIVTRPTRLSSSSATLIDHIITNVSHPVYETSILTASISDHFPIFFNIPFNRPPIKARTVESRNFSDANIAKFQNAIRNFNWNHVSDSNCAQEAYNNFNSSFMLLYNMYFPVVVTKINRNFHKLDPWMTNGILTSRQRKNHLYSVSLKNPSPVNSNNFKKFRNIYNTVLRASKKLYYENQLKNNLTNLKKTWQIINTAIKKPGKKNKLISNLHINGTNVNDPKAMADHFNKFFSTAALDIVNSINPSDIIPEESVPLNPVTFSLSNVPVSPSEIIDACKILLPKKTEDFNGISTFFIKKIIMSISKPLQHIFSLSFSTGIIPSQLKIAKIIPVYKSGDPSMPDNYRPISLLSCFSKIMEKVVYLRLFNFLDNCEILTKFQFGFRPLHSTVHPMTYLLNFVSNSLNEKKHAMALFCDLRKAFDSCDHSILLRKLSKIGIRNTELLWFTNYLTNRQQFVHVNGHSSSLINILLGVPQGSILGPILFLLYINDLPLCSNLTSLLFADDTTLLACSDNIEDLFNFVNFEFRKVVEFFRSNKIALHPSKTKYLIFSNSHFANNFDAQIFCNFNNSNDSNPTLISPVIRVKSTDDIPAIRFLGVFFDPSLNFKYHISTIRTKLSKA